MQLLGRSSAAKAVRRLLHLLVAPLLLLEVGKEDVQSRLEELHHRFVVLQRLAEVQREQLRLGLANTSQLDGVAKHDCCLAVDKLYLTGEVLLVEAEEVDAAESLEVLVDEAALVDGKLLAMPSVKVDEDW